MSNQNFHRDIKRSIQVLQGCSYVCSPCGLGPWHIVAVSITDICLVFISDDWPIRPWIPDELRQVQAPGNCRRLVHYWPPRASSPLVVEV